jgi:hypothetical protein
VHQDQHDQQRSPQQCADQARLRDKGPHAGLTEAALPER